MSTELAIYQASVPDRMAYAKALAAASLLPRAYQQQPANVLLALEYGAALGIAPMTAIQGIHVIEGKPSASAGLIGALVRKAGHRMRVTGDDTRAVCEIVRNDDPDFTFTAEWTLERARTAGLLGKGVWKSYPAAMLKARAITEAARDACPEALSGVAYTAEELGQDDAPREAPINVTRTTVAPDVDPWATPEVVDAEIVEDVPITGDVAGGGEAPATSPVMAKSVDGLLPDVKVACDALGAADRPAALALARWIAQRPLKTANDLSADEARAIIALRVQVDALDEDTRARAISDMWDQIVGTDVVTGVTPAQAEYFGKAWGDAQDANTDRAAS